MKNYIAIDDKEFDHLVSLKDAYRTAFQYIHDYHTRGESSTSLILGDMSLKENGESSDPAALEDFISAFKKISNL